MKIITKSTLVKFAYQNHDNSLFHRLGTDTKTHYVACQCVCVGVRTVIGSDRSGNWTEVATEKILNSKVIIVCT